MGWRCSTHGRNEKFIQNFSLENLLIIRIGVGEIRWGVVEWIHVGQDRDK
jgi:hypothetical protein